MNTRRQINLAARIHWIGTVRAKSVEAGSASNQHCRMTKHSPFHYFKTSREIIRLAVMLYVRFPLSLRNVEDPLHERGRGIDVSHETVRRRTCR
jgi:hypothetical protein